MTARHPLRFGLVSDSVATSWSAWRDKVRKAEDTGFDVLYMSDHFESRLGPIAGLANAAATTSTIRLGHLVLDNDYRHPATVAMETASLDVLSNGRFELGIGAGWKRSEYDALGIPFDDARIRVDRLEESLHILLELWSGRSCTFHGRHYDINSAPPLLMPAQQPHPPILIGAGGPRMLGIAGQYADIVSLVPRTLTGTGQGIDPADVGPVPFQRKVDILREAAGKRFADIELSTTIFGIAVNAAAEDVAGRVRHGIGDMWEQMRGTPHLLTGSVDSAVEDIHRYAEEWGVTHFCVFDWNLDEFAPILAKIRR